MDIGKPEREVWIPERERETPAVEPMKAPAPKTTPAPTPAPVKV